MHTNLYLVLLCISKIIFLQVSSFDHLVLTVKNLAESIAFYEKVLGMETIKFGPNGERTALQFGIQKINLHEVGKEFKPHALVPKVKRKRVKVSP